MKNQDGKPENGNDARVLKISKVCSDSRREPRNPFPDRDVLCSGAGGIRIRLDGVNPDRSATVSILDPAGEEIGRADIAEGETRLFEMGGRIYMITASDIAVGVLLIGKRAEITIDACT